MANTHSISHSFINHLQQVHYAKNEIEQQQVEGLLDRFRQFNAVAYSHMPAFYVIDYTQQDYVIMSEACRLIGNYHPQDFMDSGLSMLLDIYNKDDFKIYNDKIFRANKQFLQSVPHLQHQQYIFNYTFRVSDGKGGLTHLYQRGNYITSPETGLPLYSLGMVMNITGLYNQRRMYHSIEKTTAGNIFEQNETIQQNYFYPYEEDILLTEREKDVVSFMAEGFSIKQIADRLNIAENTVANHRKNMLHKTNTKNMAELVAFAIRNHII